MNAWRRTSLRVVLVATVMAVTSMVTGVSAPVVLAQTLDGQADWFNAEVRSDGFGLPAAVATGAPTISVAAPGPTDGTARVGDTLEIGVSGVMDADVIATGSFSYQWYRLTDPAMPASGNNLDPIADAQSNSYTLHWRDFNTKVLARAVFADQLGNRESLISEAFPSSSNVAKQDGNRPATGSVRIRNSPNVGVILRIDASEVADEDGPLPSTLTYQWYHTEPAASNTLVEISGATSVNYIVQSGDNGRRIAMKISFADHQGNTEEVTSETTEVVGPSLTAGWSISALSNRDTISELSNFLDRQVGFEVRLTRNGFRGDVAVDFTLSGTATLGMSTNDGDYFWVNVPETQTVTFSGTIDGANRIFLRIRGSEAAVASGDGLYEGDETVVVTLTNPRCLEAGCSQDRVGIASDRVVLTITDASENRRPRYKFTSAESTVTEPASGEESVLRFSVTNSSRVNTDLPNSVRWRVVESSTTAVEGVDYRLPAGSRQIDFGKQTETHSIDVVILGDDLVEANKMLVLELHDAVGGVIDVSEANAQFSSLGIITSENTFTATIDSPSVDEGDTGMANLDFVVSSANKMPFPVDVAYIVTTDSTAASGTDYTAPSGSVTIPAGANQATIRVSVIGDTEGETNETVIIQLTGVTCAECAAANIAAVRYGVATGEDGIGRGLIRDDEAPSISITSPTIMEGDNGQTEMVFQVEPTGAPAGQESVQFAISGSATLDSDFTVDSARSVIFPGGSDAAQEIVVTVIGDNTYERNEEVVITLFTPSSGIVLGANHVGTGMISNDDDAPVLSFSASSVNASVNEGDAGTAEMTFTVEKSGSTALDATVSYSVADGTATVADGDYTVPSGTSWIFLPDETSKSVTVSVTPDNRAEGDETITLALSGASDATIGTGTATGTILDDDLLTLSINSQEVVEGDTGTSDHEFTVTLGAIPPADVTVAYAVDSESTATAAGSNADYSIGAATGPLTFPADTTTLTMTIPFTVNGDTILELNETIVVLLSSPQCTCPANVDAPMIVAEKGTFTIQDDDGTRLSIRSTSVMEGNSGTAPLAFSLTLEQMWIAPIVIEYSVTGGTATAGSDYMALAASPTPSITIPAGSTSGVINISVIGDNAYELDETVEVTISLPSVDANIVLDTSMATGIITNDDDAPTLSISSPDAVLEGDSGTVDLAFTISKAPGAETALEVTVDIAVAGTASATSGDYSATLTPQITFSPVETSVTITFSINGDTIHEEDETVLITLSNPVNAVFAGNVQTLSWEGVIRDDDPLAISIQELVEVREGDSGTTSMLFRVMITSQPSSAVTVDYSVSDGTATVADGDYVRRPDGVLTFPASSTVSQYIEVLINGDQRAENHETLIVTLSSPSGGAVFAGGVLMLSATGRILTDDQPEVSISSPSVVEGNTGTTELIFIVSLSSVWHQDVSVDYRVADGTATADEDYHAVTPGTLVFEAGTINLRRSITVVVIGDNVPERDETVFATLFSPANVLINRHLGAGTGTIVSDDRRLSIHSESRVREDSGERLVYTVTLDPPADSPIEVGFQIASSSTVTAIADYGSPHPAGTVVFMTGESEKSISIAVNNDFVEETEELVLVVLVPAGDATSIEGAVIVTGEARGYIQPLILGGSSVLSIRSGRPREAGFNNEPSVDITFVMDPPREYATTVSYRVRPESGALSGVLAAGGVISTLTAQREVVIPAGEGEVTVSHPLGSTFDLNGIELLEVLVAKVTRRSGGPRDPFVRISGTQEMALVGGAYTPLQRFVDYQIANNVGLVLAGTGRSIATGLVDAIWSRAAVYRSGNHYPLAIIGGRSIDTNAFTSGVNAADAAIEVASLFGVTPVAPSASSRELENPVQAGGLETYRNWAGLPDSDSIARRSRFALTTQGGGLGSVAIWGRGNFRDYESNLEDEQFSSEAETSTFLLGADFQQRDDLVVGFALSRMSGEVAYTSANFSGEGSVNTAVTSVSPWIHWNAPVGIEVWGSLGFGTGTAEIDEDGELFETDVTSRVFAAGFRSGESSLAFLRLAARADMFVATMLSDSVTEAVVLPNTETETSRLRIAFEVSGKHWFSEVRSLEADVQLGARLDAGQGAENGTGADLTSEITFSDSVTGLSVSGRNSGLLFYDREGFSDTSFGVGVEYDPGLIGQGVQLTLEPSWNASALNSESLWDSATILETQRTSGSGMTYRARLGYGLKLTHGWSLATAYSEASKSSESTRVRMGMELRQAEPMKLRSFTLGAYGEREEKHTRLVEDAIMLEGRIGY